MTEHLPGLRIQPRHWAFLKSPTKYRAAYSGAIEGEHELLPEPTRRQFKTAASILKRLRTQKGVVLADDVGLGKTTVAALVAGVFAGRGQRVRILAPNPAMARRWRKELARQLAVLQVAAPSLKEGDLLHASKRLSYIGKLTGADIQVTTQGKVTPRKGKAGRAVDCDLLIVDEAHRARSEGSNFGKLLFTKRKGYGRVLLLTATPFSLNVAEMRRVLRLVGADDATLSAARGFGRLLDELWADSFGEPRAFGKSLGESGAAAAKALRKWVVRHCVEQLPHERAQYGSWCPWPVSVPQVSERSVELLIRGVRAFDLAKKKGSWTQSRTNDPRFHQGWQHLGEELSGLKAGRADKGRGTDGLALKFHRNWVRRALDSAGRHEKIDGAVKALEQVVVGGEKVLVFCDFHATAQELARAAHNGIKRQASLDSLSQQDWVFAWRSVLEEEGLRFSADTPAGQERDLKRLGQFVKWLSCDALRSQVAGWLPQKPASREQLVQMLKRTRARQMRAADTIKGAAVRLFRELNDKDSTSTREVLLRGPSGLPGWGPQERLLMSTARAPKGAEAGVFFGAEPDTVMAIFNSPFGPDVLIATGKMSEGVDLHRSCRHVMHYELNPSPIRTVQQRGRVRRIGSWASKTGLPIMEAYPSLQGTRDSALVRITKQRLSQFDLLLGGVRDVELDTGQGDGPRRQLEAFKEARRHLRGLTLAVVPSRGARR